MGDSAQGGGEDLSADTFGNDKQWEGRRGAGK